MFPVEPIPGEYSANSAVPILEGMNHFKTVIHASSPLSGVLKILNVFGISVKIEISIENPESTEY